MVVLQVIEEQNISCSFHALHLIAPGFILCVYARLPLKIDSMMCLNFAACTLKKSKASKCKLNNGI